MEGSKDQGTTHEWDSKSRPESRWQTAILVGLLVIPLLVGTSSAQRWPNLDNDFYSGASQVIATLFVAIALEFFSRTTPPWSDRLERAVVLCLMAISWAGLFASIRATIDTHGGPINIALTTAGLMSTSILVCVALFDRIGTTGLVLTFLLAPVLIMVVL